MAKPLPMSQCPNCGKVYDESEDPICPYCNGGRRRFKMIVLKKKK